MDKRINQVLDCLADGDGEQAVISYQKIVNQLNDQTRHWFESLFGLASLAGVVDLQQSQIDSSSLINDFCIAKQAYEAYCQNQPAIAVQGLLKSLSYDSAFKDFRLLLSALLDIDSGSDHLAKLDMIPESSPYRAMVNLVRLGVKSSNQSPEFSTLSTEEQNFIEALNARTVATTDHLPPLESNSKQLFQWLIDHADSFESGTLKTTLSQLLIDYPEGLDVYLSRVEKLTDFEQKRIQALAFERCDDWQNARQCWDDCIQFVDQASIETSETVIQLILERINYCHDQLGYDTPQQQIAILEQRFQKNPEDIETCLQLLQLYQSTDQQTFKQFLNRAILKFPQHPVIVATAVENANEASEFEQAARIARNLLDNDSLNQNARQLLIKSYLSYADKLILRGQIYAAETLLDQIEALERPKSSGIVCLHRALMCYVTGDETKAQQLVEQGCLQLDSYLIGYLHMVIETGRLGFKTKYKKQYLKLLQNLVGYQPKAAEMVTIMQLLQEAENDTKVDGPALLTGIRPFLLRSLYGDFQKEQLYVICSILEQMNLYEDLYKVGQNGCQRNNHSDDVFEYYRIIGLTQGNPALLNTDDSILLGQLLDQNADKNPELHSRMTAFLNSNLAAANELTSDVTVGMKSHTDMKISDLLTTFKRIFSE